MYPWLIEWFGFEAIHLFSQWLLFIIVIACFVTKNNNLFLLLFRQLRNEQVGELILFHVDVIFQRYKKVIKFKSFLLCHGKASFRSFWRCLKSAFWSVWNWVNTSRFECYVTKNFESKPRFKMLFTFVWYFPFNRFFFSIPNNLNTTFFVSMRLARLHPPVATLSKSTIWLRCPDRRH